MGSCTISLCKYENKNMSEVQAISAKWERAHTSLFFYEDLVIPTTGKSFKIHTVIKAPLSP